VIPCRVAHLLPPPGSGQHPNSASRIIEIFDPKRLVLAAVARRPRRFEQPAEPSLPKPSQPEHLAPPQPRSSAAVARRQPVMDQIPQPLKPPHSPSLTAVPSPQTPPAKSAGSVIPIWHRGYILNIGRPTLCCRISALWKKLRRVASQLEIAPSGRSLNRPGLSYVPPDWPIGHDFASAGRTRTRRSGERHKPSLADGDSTTFRIGGSATCE